MEAKYKKYVRQLHEPNDVRGERLRPWPRSLMTWVIEFFKVTVISTPLLISLQGNVHALYSESLFLIYIVL